LAFAGDSTITNLPDRLFLDTDFLEPFFDLLLPLLFFDLFVAEGGGLGKSSWSAV